MLSLLLTGRNRGICRWATPETCASAMELRFLYIGTSDTGRDLATWLAIPGAQLRWRFQHFDADVAAVDLGAPPLVMLADHRRAGAVLAIYAVDALVEATRQLEAGGLEVVKRSFGTPEGPATLLRDASGTELALLQVERPNAMDNAYADQSNTHRVL
jgi:hypothetical protein